MKKDNYWSIRKFLDDTLKENSSWSMKRICVAVLLPYYILLTTYIVISDRILGEKVVNPYAIQISDSVLVFIATALGMTLVANYLIEKVKSKSDTYQEKTTSETTITTPKDEQNPLN